MLFFSYQWAMSEKRWKHVWNISFLWIILQNKAEQIIVIIFVSVAKLL